MNPPINPGAARLRCRELPEDRRSPNQAKHALRLTRPPRTFQRPDRGAETNLQLRYQRLSRAEQRDALRPMPCRERHGLLPC